MAIGLDPAIAELGFAISRKSSSDRTAQFYLGQRAQKACERLNCPTGLEEDPLFCEWKKVFGIRDFNALTLLDTSGIGLAFFAPTREVTKSRPVDLRRLERVGAHILAGFRLRRRLHRVDAVLGPDGKLLHAEPSAQALEHRDALRSAVKALDRAQSKHGAADVDEALSGWEALISGRWSLVESFESDGRRYLLARENAPDEVRSAAVSALEAQALLLRAQGASYKLMAYELGVSGPAAHRLVVRATKKLGIRHDAELPGLLTSGKLTNTESSPTLQAPREQAPRDEKPYGTKDQ
jgi:DNA-binding CsgD family transcriptional regulator